MDHSALVHEVRDRSSYNWPVPESEQPEYSAIHEEMPFGIGVLVSDDVDGL